METTRRQLLDETLFQEVVQDYVKVVNSRLNPVISRGHSWVRVAPTTLEEFELEVTNPIRIRFHRVGSLVRIGDYEYGLVELRSSRFTFWISEKELLTCWIRVVSEREWIPSS